MTSTPARPARPHVTDPLDHLLERADAVIAQARESGALQPIRTEQTWIEDGSLRFSVRWVSSLALKDRARVDTVIRRRPDFNPFLPPEPSLTVADIGADHLVVLNKFPVIDRHLLIVTRRFEDQRTPLTRADFEALGAVIARHGGLGFYNGGRIAGASQAHKHLQWVPASAASLDDFLPDTPAAEACAAFVNPLLPWAHAFVRVDDDGAALTALSGEAVGARLGAAFREACRALGLPAEADPMPPYNLLVSRRALLLVPRSGEKWQDVSVNSLAYAGSLFVRDREQIDRLRACGPLAVIAAVGHPTR
ncbi:MAG: ATP adenylyltransferase family protein [Thauera sp.]